jgi:homoserine acetyltransferase
MDLFDLTASALNDLKMKPINPPSSSVAEVDLVPKPAYMTTSHSKSHIPPPNPPAYLDDLAEGLAPLAHIPTLILGVQSDILFPVEQQREVADALRMAGNSRVSYYELGGVWGHDTFLYAFIHPISLQLY